MSNEPTEAGDRAALAWKRGKLMALARSLEYCADHAAPDSLPGAMREVAQKIVAALSPQSPGGGMALCMCKDRPLSECPGEWEPGCDLGNNEKFVRVVDAPLQTLIDASIAEAQTPATARSGDQDLGLRTSDASAPLDWREFRIPVTLPDGRIAKMRKCDLRGDDEVTFIDSANLPPHGARDERAPTAPEGFTEYRALDYIKTEEQLQLYIAARIEDALAAPSPPDRAEAVALSDGVILGIAAQVASLSLNMTRAHELGGKTRTIMDEVGVIEFARAILAAQRSGDTT